MSFKSSMRAGLRKAMRQEMRRKGEYVVTSAGGLALQAERQSKKKVSAGSVEKSDFEKAADKELNAETLAMCKEGRGKYCKLKPGLCDKDGKKAGEGGKPWCTAKKRRDMYREWMRE